MENGVGVVDATQFGERNGAEEKFMDSGMEKEALLGSDESKESEGDDEEFEEAVQGDTPRVVDTKVKIDGDDGNHEKNEGLILADEAEKFEEAVVSPNYAEKEDALVTDETSSPVKDMGNQLDGSEDNGIVPDEKEKLSGVAGETNDVEDGSQVNDEVIQPEKPENGVLDHVPVDELQSHDTDDEVVDDQQGKQEHEPLETRDANEVKGGDTVPDPGIEAHGLNVEINETDSILDGGLSEKHGELDNTSTRLLPEHHDSQIQDQKENPVNDIKEKEPLNVSGGNEDDQENQETIQVDSAIASVQNGESHEPEPESNLDSLPKENAEDSKPDQAEEINAGVLADNTLRSSADLSDVSSVVSEAVVKEPERNDESEKVNQTILLTKADFTDAVTSKAVVIEPENKDNNEVNRELDQSIPQRKEENELHPETTVASKAMVIPSENKDNNKANGERNQAVPETKEQGVLPASTLSSSGGISATTPAQPAGLAHSALGTREQEKNRGNREDKGRPAGDTSSSSNRSATSTAASSRPAGLGRAAPLAPLLESAPRAVQQPRVNGSASPVQSQLIEDPTNGEAEENDETREKLQMIRVKFLRLAHRLGQTPHNVVVAQVLYRLGLAEQLRGRNGGRVGAFSFDRASAMAEQLEAAGQEPLDFSCTIMVLGKTGVGKSATINSIFDEIMFGTDAFQLGTKRVQDVVGFVQGIKVRVIDTPGLLPSWSDQRKNEKILHSVKNYIKKTPPDIVLYLDRLDMPSREFGDMPLLRTITDIFGPSIWFNAIVVLTHAASAPPEGPNGTATSYDMFVTQRSHVVQQAIRLAAGDMRLMNPVSLVENHSACRTNRAGQRVLPNGQVWKPHLLLLSFASKILAEANTLLKLQDSPPGKPFVSRTRSPPLPFLLSSLLQSRPPVKLPMEQYGDDDDTLDDDLDDSSGSEDESEFDELPPFKRLTKAQLAKLPKNQRKAYYDELEYREKLFMKKQLREEKKRRKMMKKMQAAANDLPTNSEENVEEESAGAASVPVPMPDLALPASFDSDNPTHRYRCLDSSNQWLVRPVLEPNGWDHDVGYEGINAERLFVVRDKIPISFSGQVSKDKKDTNLQMEVASTVKHGEGKATSLGFDLQSVGKDIAYTLRSETRFSNWKKNKAVAGLSMTLLGDILTGGLKVEDKLIVNKQGQLVASAGAIVGRGDVAYGGSFEATFRDKDPLGRFLSTLGLSVMDWHGDLAIGCNFQSQIPIGRTTNLIGRLNVNNRGSGQFSIRVNSSEHLQIALISLVPLVRKLLYHSQPVQFG
ncbi:hypothetical protein M9H77_33872 [Catharanthus roseus]|uniref:Uncharacterized protein n=1 Tax=Catharanthus roseus TaxID=4058 RepID=A0ACB9ZNS5_CATRO|nr:hypothetical protein M9H77_33872 [Catharanthus roseus]